MDNSKNGATKHVCVYSLNFSLHQCVAEEREQELSYMLTPMCMNDSVCEKQQI